MIKPWITEKSVPKGEYRIFKVRSDFKKSPRNGHVHDFTIIEAVDWVNVIAVTPEQQLVMIEQLRHGTNTVELEIPGGVMDPGEESPLATGIRELREETGYEGRDARIIGEVFPNPAIMNNTCFTVMISDCELKHPTKFDLAEDIITRLMPLNEIPRLVAENRIKHSLVVAALYHLELLGREN